MARRASHEAGSGGVDVLEPDGSAHGGAPDHGVGRTIGRELVGAVLIAVMVIGLAVWVARRNGSPGEATGTETPTVLATYAGHRSEVYADPAHWVCRPDKVDACDQNLDTTVIAADGSTSIERFVADDDAPIDCFYVYPTVSKDPMLSSDRTMAADQEGAAAHLQAGRFGSVCRVFAPVYRQRTMTDLLGGVDAAKGGGPSPYDIAYDDVLDAFKQYVANDNGGRGIVLIGQAQGSTLLTALVKREIAPNPELRSHLVSAILAGFPTSVDSADPDAVPACRVPGQLGCIVSFAAFRKTAPPPVNAAYGRGRVCTNPAALGGARATLHSYFPTDRHLPFIDPALSPAGAPWLVGGAPPITTPFVSTPGLLEGECVTRGPFTYLEVTVHGDAGDPRTDDITGDLLPSWGLHLVDFDLVMGDLVETVREQRDAYARR